MKIFITLILISFSFFSCNNSKESSNNRDFNLETDDEKIHYSIGYQYGSNLRQDSVDLIIQNYMEGLQDALYDRGNKLDEATYNEMIQKFNEFVMYSRQIAPTALTPEEFIRENEAKFAAIGFEMLESNANKPEVKISDSGLQYTIIKQGKTDKEFIDGYVALVELKAWFPDSTLIIDSEAAGNISLIVYPSAFTEGWTEAINLAGEGGEIDVLTPSELAFGEEGFPDPAYPERSVPPNVAIFAKIKVKEIVPADDEPRLRELQMEASN